LARKDRAAALNRICSRNNQRLGQGGPFRAISRSRAHQAWLVFDPRRNSTRQEQEPLAAELLAGENQLLQRCMATNQRTARMTDENLERLLNELISRPQVKPDRLDRWYSRSYPVFVAHAENRDSPEDLVRVMAYAASWVRLIPAARPTEDPGEVATLNAALRTASTAKAKNERRAYEAAIRAARKAFGLREDSASIVLLSKAMHFLRPMIAPMIDTRVGEAWSSLAREHSFLRPRSLLSGTSGAGKQRKPIPTSSDYANYWVVARRLVNVGRTLDPQFDYRKLDLLLFRYGKELNLVKAESRR
jgi:hypothetical protein